MNSTNQNMQTLMLFLPFNLKLKGWFLPVSGNKLNILGAVKSKKFPTVFNSAGKNYKKVTDILQCKTIFFIYLLF